MKTRVYTFDNGVELRLDPARHSWSLRTAEGVAITDSKVGAHLAEGDKVLGQFVDAQRRRFSDPAGSGERVIAEFVNNEHQLSFHWQLDIYERRPTLAISFSVTNNGPVDLQVEDIFAVDGTLLQGLGVTDRCRVLNNGPGACGFLWYPSIVEPVSTALDPGSQIEAYWSTAVSAPTENLFFAIGMGHSPSAFYRFVFSRQEDDVGLYASALQETGKQFPWKESYRHALDPQSENVPINPLLLKPGRKIDSRFVIACSESIHATLDNYTDHVRDYLEINLRFGPVTGVFGDYACEPSFRSMDAQAVNRERLSTILDILQEKLQKYGLTYILFTLGVGIAAENAPDDFDWRAVLSEEALRTIDVSHPDFRGSEKDYQLENYFPEGIRSFTDEIHNRGFEAAFHYTELNHVKSGPPEWDDVAARHAKEKFVDEWGFDYLFVGVGYPPYNLQRDQTIIEAFRRRLTRIREEIGSDIFLTAHFTMPPAPEVYDGGRVALDFRGGREVILLHQLTQRYYYHGKWFQLDPEFCDAAAIPYANDSGAFGKPGMSPLEKIISPLEKTKAWISLQAIACWSFFVGGALEKTSDERFDLLTRALPVYPGRGYPLDLMAEQNPLSVWLLPVSHPWGGNHTVVGLFNWSSEEQARTVSFRRKDVVGDEGEYLLFDFWFKRFLGSLEEEFVVTLPPFTCQVLFATEKGKDVTFIGSDRHISGSFALNDWRFDPREGVISGESEGPTFTEHSLFFYLTEDIGPLSFEGCTAELVQMRVLRVTVSFSEEGTQQWKVKLDRQTTVAHFEEKYGAFQFSPSIITREPDRNLPAR